MFRTYQAIYQEQIHWGRHMFVHSFNLSAVHCAIILGFSWHLETCKKRNSIHLNSYTLFSCILRKIIISTNPWQPGSKNWKDCPILHIYLRIKGCYCKLFLEHSGLKLNLCNSNKFANSVCLSKGHIF